MAAAWPNGYGVRLRIGRLWVRVPSWSIFLTICQNLMTWLILYKNSIVQVESSHSSRYRNFRFLRLRNFDRPKVPGKCPGTIAHLSGHSILKQTLVKSLDFTFWLLKSFWTETSRLTLGWVVLRWREGISKRVKFLRFITDRPLASFSIL